MATNSVPPAPGSSAAPAPEQKMSAIARIFGALFSPKAAFTDICARPGVVLPMLLLLVSMLGGVYAVGQHVGWDRFARQQMDKNPRAAAQIEQLPPDQRDAAYARGTVFTKYIAYAIPFLYPPFLVFAVGGILLGAVNVMTGASIDYRRATAIVAYSAMPLVIGGLLGILVIMLKDPSTIDVQRLMASNLAVVTSGDSPAWEVALASKIDIFTFWEFALMAIGFAAANPKKITIGKAWATILTTWGIWVVVSVGLTAAFS